jgi:hypothetical protein
MTNEGPLHPTEGALFLYLPTCPRSEQRAVNFTGLTAIAGTVDITATNASGTSAVTAADKYTYVAPPVIHVPAITAISPAKGPLGTAVVKITGKDLNGASTVTFGTAAATGVSCTATLCTVTAPAGDLGTVDVQVRTSGGTSPITAADQYTRFAAPTVTSISPGKVLPAGGTTVTVTGTNLAVGGTVNLGGSGVPLKNCSDTSCTAVTGAANDGALVIVVVTTPGGYSAQNYSAYYQWTSS